MAEIRQATILIRDRQVSGGALPSNALLAEPFVNLYDGVLKFSGVTGGGFEPSSVSSVFEVGSTLFNSKITNRLNINDNFIISGGTGLITTYGASSTLTGKFLSGTTSGFVLANISDIQGTNDITRVQPGSNITTGGTGNFPTVSVVASPSFNNITFSGSAIGNALSATTMSAGTIYSGSTNLYSIFALAGSIAGVTNVNPGSNITTGGTVTSPIINVSASPSFNNISFSGTATGVALSATTLSAGTIYSGSTNIQNLFVNNVSAGTNITIGGTAINPTVNVASSPVFTGLVSATGFTDSSLTPGRIVYAGTSGRLTDEAGFTYNATTDTLSVARSVFGVPGQTGTTATIYGDLIIMGQGISGFTSELYIEDNLIELNYNPTASTESTSLGAGWSIQDGSGIAGTDAIFDIRGASTGVANRSFATNLNDIRIRETGTISSPNGVRLIAENDLIDGGSY